MPRAGELDREKPELAAAIVSLPWVADGIDAGERGGVDRLVVAALQNESVFLAVMEREWVVDGLSRVERDVVESLGRFLDEASAERIAWMPFLDRVELRDGDTVALLDWLDTVSMDLLRAVLDKPWTADGLNETERYVVRVLEDWVSIDDSVALRVLNMPFLDTVEPDDLESVGTLWSLTSPEVVTVVINNQWVEDGLDVRETEAVSWLRDFRDAQVAASVAGLEWVRDGIEVLDLDALQYLNWVEAQDVELGALVVRLGWVQDGMDELEVDAVEQVFQMASDDVELAVSLVGLDWVRDGMNALEVEALEWMNNFDGGSAVRALIWLGWVQDGVEELEVRAIETLSYINYDDEDLAASVVGLGWVQDGVDASELAAIEWIGNFDSVLVAKLVVGLGWVQDGVSRDAIRTIEELSYLANVDAGRASNIVEMPFLETLEPADTVAVDALSSLATFREDDFRRILSHPTLAGGIYDDWAMVVATLYNVNRTHPQLVNTLLDPSQVTLDERTITLPLAGETQLAIIRTGPGVDRSMDLLEHAVRHAESYMGTPFPTGYVGWLVGDAVSPSFAGTNYGTHFSTLAKYDVDDGSYEAEFVGALVAHEVAHYYWRGNESWVDEGIADLMASISENARAGRPVEVTNNPCGYVRTIAELEQLDLSISDGSYSAFTCNYSLGERLFADLHRTLGDRAFRMGLQDLYERSQGEDEFDIDGGESMGIEDVRLAFKAVGSVEPWEVDVVTARWYEGIEPYDTSHLGSGLSSPILRTINGRVHTAYLSDAQEGPVLTRISASDVDDYIWLLLRWDYEVGSSVEVPLEIVHYYEDGFTFGRRSLSFTADARYNDSLWYWWLKVGQSPEHPWATGDYGIRVYNEGRKLVELEYVVTP